MSSSQVPLPADPLPEVLYPAPFTSEANALERGLLRVQQDWFLALVHQRLREEADAAFGEVDVDHSHMAAATLAAIHAPADLFGGLDRAAYTGLGDFTYALDSDEE